MNIIQDNITLGLCTLLEPFYSFPLHTAEIAFALSELSALDLITMQCYLGGTLTSATCQKKPMVKEGVLFLKR